MSNTEWWFAVLGFFTHENIIKRLAGIYGAPDYDQKIGEYVA
jgi:hypothetical protein